MVWMHLNRWMKIDDKKSGIGLHPEDEEKKNDLKSHGHEKWKKQ